LLVDQFRLPYLLEIRPNTEFHPEASKNKLINLNLHADDGPRVNYVTPGDALGADVLNDDGEATGRREQLLRFAGWVDLDNTISVGGSKWP
jgi:DNA mismatch repair protein MSH5